jgi:predicted RNase H-like HicB family nuclease
MAHEAIDAHCELLAEKGLKIPVPRPLAEHRANPDLAGAVWFVLDFAEAR